jgi:hypothetical protein
MTLPRRIRRAFDAPAGQNLTAPANLRERANRYAAFEPEQRWPRLAAGRDEPFREGARLKSDDGPLRRDSSKFLELYMSLARIGWTLFCVSVVCRTAALMSTLFIGGAPRAFAGATLVVSRYVALLGASIAIVGHVCTWLGAQQRKSKSEQSMQE